MTRLPVKNASQECILDTESRKSSLTSFLDAPLQVKQKQLENNSDTDKPGTLIRTVSEKNKVLQKGLKKVGGYMVKGKLGAGASGRVCHVLSSDNNLYAMKVVPLKPVPEERETQIQKLKNEAHCLAKCQGHENIVQFKEAMISDSAFYLVTESAPFGDVFDHIAFNGLFPADVTRQIFFQIMSGIQHMHSRGVGHRDMKPENILLFYDNVVKICDFGFAIEWNKGDELQKKSMGTVRCLPPEMIKTATCSQPMHDPQAADIWSCGVVLFYLLTGRFPFDGQNEQETLKNIVKCRFTRPLPINNNAVDLLQKMLNLNPKKRYTAEQVLEHPYLKHFQDSAD